MAGNRAVGGKRISIISVTNDDDADAARLRYIQQKQQRETQNQQDFDDDVGSDGFGRTTIQLGEPPRPTFRPTTNEQQRPVSNTYSDLPPPVTQSDINTQEISSNNNDYVQTNSNTGSAQNDANHLAVSAPDFDFTNGEVPEDVIIPQKKVKKPTGSIRSLREVIAMQKGTTPQPARKDRAKLALSPSDPIFDDILNQPEAQPSTSSGTTQRDSTSYSQAVVPPPPPPPHLSSHHPLQVKPPPMVT